MVSIVVSAVVGHNDAMHDGRWCHQKYRPEQAKLSVLSAVSFESMVSKDETGWVPWMPLLPNQAM